MTTPEIIAAISATVAALALILNFTKDRRGTVADSQAVRDKLDYISDTVRDTREDVRALDRKLDDHATRITKIEALVDDHERRIEKLGG